MLLAQRMVPRVPPRLLHRSIRAMQAKRFVDWSFGHYLDIAPPSFAATGSPPRSAGRAQRERRGLDNPCDPRAGDAPLCRPACGGCARRVAGTRRRRSRASPSRGRARRRASGWPSPDSASRGRRACGYVLGGRSVRRASTGPRGRFRVRFVVPEPPAGPVSPDSALQAKGGVALLPHQSGVDAAHAARRPDRARAADHSPAAASRAAAPPPPAPTLVAAGDIACRPDLVGDRQRAVARPTRRRWWRASRPTPSRPSATTSTSTASSRTSWLV